MVDMLNGYDNEAARAVPTQLARAAAVIKPGRYVLAVSGGVDSMVLLDLLASQPDFELIVAHFDHGIRADSAKDGTLVCAAAQRYGSAYVCERGELGQRASEATARQARYGFLRRAMLAYQAQAIVTAHHGDDVLETATLNLLRGTGRKGLTSLDSRDELLRPLLQIPKKMLLEYAQVRRLSWREDSTNATDRYRRNQVRHHLMSRMPTEQRAEFERLLAQQRAVNIEIDALLGEILVAQPAPHYLNRQLFAMLPYAVAAELMAAWLRQNHLGGFGKKRLHQLVVFAKTASPGKQSPLSANCMLHIRKQFLQIVPAYRTPKPE